MDSEFRKWMKWYGKKHGDYTVRDSLDVHLRAFNQGDFLLLIATCVLIVFWFSLSSLKGVTSFRKSGETG